MRCPSCNSYNTENAVICVVCGGSLKGPLGTLPVGTCLQQGDFSVRKVLGQGGFGITYLAKDNRLKRPVAIKELFTDRCLRQGSSVVPSGAITQETYQHSKAKFIEEAQTLARFRHPSIVPVYSFFEENNTAYMVMEFLEGKTLLKLVEEQGVLPEKKALAYIKQVAKALSVVHQANYLHRDISPDNIMVTDNDRAVLIDFGTARAFVAGKTQSMTEIAKPGYAPLEQYGSQARFGPYTDIYALGGTLYYLLTAKVPVSSLDRAQEIELSSVRELNPKVSKKTSQAVMQAMAMRVDERPQSIDAFLNLLVSSQSVSQKTDVQSPRANIRCYSCGRMNSVRGDETAFSCRYCGTNINVAARQSELVFGETVPNLPEREVTCPICEMDIRAENLVYHLADTHPDCFLSCPVCDVEVKAKNLKHHLDKVHAVTADSIFGSFDSILEFLDSIDNEEYEDNWKPNPPESKPVFPRHTNPPDWPKLLKPTESKPVFPRHTNPPDWPKLLKPTESKPVFPRHTNPPDWSKLLKPTESKPVFPRHTNPPPPVIPNLNTRPQQDNNEWEDNNEWVSGCFGCLFRLMLIGGLIWLIAFLVGCSPNLNKKVPLQEDVSVSRSQTYWFRLQGSREQRAEEKIRIRKWDLK